MMTVSLFREVQKFQKELKKAKSRDLRNLCESYGITPRKSLKWMRLRLAYAYQEKLRNSFGQPTPEKVLKRIQELDAQPDVRTPEDVEELKQEKREERKLRKRLKLEHEEEKPTKMGVIRLHLYQQPSTREELVKKVLEEMPKTDKARVHENVRHYLYKWTREGKVRKDEKGVYHWIGPKRKRDILE